MHNSKELLCPVCNSNSSIEIYFSNIALYRCPVCDHCFSHFDGELEEYGAEYFNIVHGQWFSNPHISLFESIYAYFHKYKIDASVIDIGCGKGDFLRYIHQKNPALSLTGIDFAPNSLEEGIEYFQGDIFAVNINRKYDVVASLAVFEHVFDVKRLANKVYDLCNPGGLVIITTINDRSVLYATARLLYKFGYRTALERLYSNHHVNHFNVSSLKRLLQDNGLLVKKVFLHNMPLKAVDIPSNTLLTSAILRFGTWGTFILGRLTGGTFLQTVICQKENLP